MHRYSFLRPDRDGRPGDLFPGGCGLGFIGGFRSGTTLLINVLGLHPLITPWYETKFLPEALRWMYVIRNPGEHNRELMHCSPQEPAGFGLEAVAGRMRRQMEYDDDRLRGRVPSGKREYERYPLGADRIHYPLDAALRALGTWRLTLSDTPDLAVLATATGQLFRTLAEQELAIKPAQVLINKTPELPRFGHELRACLGGCKIILLIRDGREVVRSAAALGWAEPSRLAYLWSKLILESRRAGAEDPGNYLEVRYEDLVTDPINTLDRIYCFLGISPQGEEMVSGYQRLMGTAISPPVPTVEEGKPVLDGITQKVAGDLLAELGYLA